MKWAKTVLVHLLCDEAVEPLVMVCICSSEQGVDAESLHSLQTAVLVRGRKIHPGLFKYKDISVLRGPDLGKHHCGFVSQQGPVLFLSESQTKCPASCCLAPGASAWDPLRRVPWLPWCPDPWSPRPQGCRTRCILQWFLLDPSHWVLLYPALMVSPEHLEQVLQEENFFFLVL